MITVNINGTTVTVVGNSVVDGVGSMRMIQACMLENSGGNVTHNECWGTDTITLHTADLDYPMCAVDIVHLVQYINHQAHKCWDKMPAPAIYLRWQHAGDVAG